VVDVGASTDPDRSIVRLLRDGVLDAQLAALVWLLADGGLPVNVGAADAARGRSFAAGLQDMVDEVGVLPGGSLEEVLAATPGEPARLGVVVIVGPQRVSAAHYVRPPLRDAGGHIRDQGPAVLASWEEGLASFEHFDWAIAPELAERTGQRAGDLEIERDRRRDFLSGLAAAGVVERPAVRVALDAFRRSGESSHRQ
jgi:hypothetical protein